MQINRYRVQENSFDTLGIKLEPGTRMYLKGDLWAGKTTLSRWLIRRYLHDQTTEVTSPTYTYYKKYGGLFHFDLYRIESYEDFVNIGGEEIFEASNAVCIVEWPEKIEKYYPPTLLVEIRKLPEEPLSREITVSRPNG